MAASKTLSPERRKTRAANAVAVAHERTRLIKGIADELFGESLATKTTDELREIRGGIGVAAMNYPGKHESRPVPSGLRIPTGSCTVADNSRECIACLGHGMPVYAEHYDNHPTLGPVCLACIARLFGDREFLSGEGQCDGCGDTDRVRYLGHARLCIAHCVPRLRTMPSREVAR